ncbi:type VI lipase adapter Tla3 domain-containing protein [Pseudoduganella chitinolytica]|uniref:DUF2875 family protein n=1 Tax=Pseudoduganella chitinolytica TaxID=34070 RepID=A0ABY8BA78_9BURK|nr:DUF2875 family protein [Pseudoduganella chitinolytica]WEF31998.1 DUF2875 family protein [Pseudoduganella chitinolytica]
MSDSEFAVVEPISRPKGWKYLVGATAGLLVFLSVSFLLDVEVVHPEAINGNQEMMMPVIRWFAVPLAAITLLFGASWIVASVKADARQRVWHEKNLQLKANEAASKSEKARREYVLEVIGLGVTVEKYRQGALWQVLQSGTPFTSIREQDPKKYEWSMLDKIGVSGSRACDALENGAESSPMFWGVPSFYAGGPINNPAAQPSELSPEPGLAASAEGTGMAWHLFVTGPWQLGERPDQLLEEIFAFFDAHPDLPYVVLTAEDSAATRDALRDPSTASMIENGYYIPEMPDATAVIILARRERVEPLRPFVWEDPDNDYLQENLRMMYYELKETVPTREKLANPDKFHGGRLPTVAEWLTAAAKFAKHPIFEKKERGISMAAIGRWFASPPKDWKPTPWFPVPWNRNQMEVFDRLPSLGFIHRPVFVKYEDEHGQPVKRRDARQKILEKGWQQALQTLPASERAKGPVRIIGAFGGNVEQHLAFEGTLHSYAAQGGPEIDTSKTAQFINTDHRFGNTGAATFFVQMALGVMGSVIEGGTSAAVNLRDPNGASIVFISPPTDGRREAQPEWNPFKHEVAPAIDPENYKPPTVGEVMPTRDASTAGH